MTALYARRTGRSEAKWVVVLTSALLVAGCDGDNVFEIHDPVVGDDDGPEVVHVERPADVSPGDTLSMEVQAEGPEPIEVVQAELVLGAHQDAVTGGITPPETQVTVPVTFPIPTDPEDDVAVVTVWVEDEASNRSEEVEEEVPVVGDF